MIIQQKTCLCLITAMLSINVYAADTDALHFHTVKKSADEKHVSMIPRTGYTRKGNIKHAYNPNSIVYQQRELLKQLQQEQENLDAIAEIEAREQLEKDNQGSGSLLDRVFLKPNKDIIRNSSNDGVLEDLIELEKRAGRAKSIEE